MSPKDICLSSMTARLYFLPSRYCAPDGPFLPSCVSPMEAFGAEAPCSFHRTVPGTLEPHPHLPFSFSGVKKDDYFVLQ